MNRVFISYSRKNEAFAERIARDLSDAGLDVWIDLRQIQVGELWEQEIYRGLERAEFIVLCLSPASLASEWVQREVMTTKEAGKRIYPVMVEDCFKELQAHPTLSWLTAVQFIKFEGRYEQAFPELLEALPGGRKLGAYDIYNPANIPNPFKGLEAFQQRDAAYFFGREDVIQRALNRMRRTRFLAVVGASGSGKSSIVRAGIIPQIRNGALPGSDTFPVLIFTPGANPLESFATRLHPLIAANYPARTPETVLADLRDGNKSISVLLEALTNLPETARLLLVIDQFEEVFTRAAGIERQQFLDLLRLMVTADTARTQLLVTMRSDFFGHLSHYPELAALFEGDNLLIVAEMTTANLIQAIEGPAKAVGLKYDAGLVEKILEDVKSQPGSLPLLQYALKELYERRDGARLTLAAYEAIGGVRQALAKHAENIYSQLGSAQQEHMRRVLLRLVEVGSSGEATRRRVPRNELSFRDIADEDEDAILEILTAPDSRLLTASRSINTGGTEPVTWYEVSHEALIREWERFRDWVASSADNLRYESEIRKAAQDWHNGGKDAAYLLTGKRLNRAEIWLEDSEATSLQREFIAASILARAEREQTERQQLERELKLQRQSRLLLGLGFLVSTILLMFAAAAFLTARNTNIELENSQLQIQQANSALEEQIRIARENEATARSLAVAASAGQALADNNGDLALALAVAAVSGENTPPEAARTLADVSFAPGTRFRIATASRVTALEYSADGKFIAVGFQNGGLQVIDALTSEVVQTFAGHTGAITDVAFNQNASQLLSSSNDASGNFLLWDVATGQLIRDWAAYNHQRVNATAFLGTEPINATENVTQIVTGPDDLVIVGTRGGEVRRLRGEALVWSRFPFPELPVNNQPRVTSFSLHPDGQTVLVGFTNGSMVLIAVDDGEIVQEFTRLDNSVVGLSFLGNGTQFAVAGSDDVLRLWDSVTGRQTHTFDVDATITAFAADPRSSSVSTGIANNTLRIWDIGGSLELKRTSEGFIAGVAISPDGSRAAISGVAAGTVRIRDAQTGELIQDLVLPGVTDLVAAITFSPDGARLAAITTSGTLSLWNPQTLELIRTVNTQHTGFVLTLAYSHDGSLLATGSSDRKINLWDAATWTLVRSLSGHTDSITSLAFNTDGTQLLSGASDRSLILWNLADGNILQRFTGHMGTVKSVALSSDNTLAMSGSTDATVRIWNVETGREVRRFTGHDQDVTGVLFVGDDDMLSVSSDGTVRLWDSDTGFELRRYSLTNERGRAVGVKSMSVPLNGNQVLVGLGDATLRLLQLLPEKADLLAWTQENRFIRDLTCDERIQFNIDEILAQGFATPVQGTVVALSDEAGNVITSLADGTPLRILAEPDNMGRVRVCTADGQEGLVDNVAVAE